MVVVVVGVGAAGVVVEMALGGNDMPAAAVVVAAAAMEPFTFPPPSRGPPDGSIQNIPRITREEGSVRGCEGGGLK